MVSDTTIDEFLQNATRVVSELRQAKQNKVIADNEAFAAKIVCEAARKALHEEASRGEQLLKSEITRTLEILERKDIQPTAIDSNGERVWQIYSPPYRESIKKNIYLRTSGLLATFIYVQTGERFSGELKTEFIEFAPWYPDATAVVIQLLRSFADAA